MRVLEITKEVIEAIKEDKYDFIAINFCSPDMVGHTGNYNAAVTGIEAIDYCLGKINEVIQEKIDKYAWIITSDHGNADIMWDDANNQPHTQHTNSSVPFVLISDIKCKLDRKESLQDVAPTILDLMGIEKPAIMTGESLILINKDEK
jgi:2,3-bisphosphoglycerate-independent phosphoglycerate mutase